MGFKKIDDINHGAHDRKSVILINFNEVEFNTLKDIINKNGLDDVIFVGNDMFDSKVIDILNDEGIKGESFDIDMKVMLFNQVEGKDANGILEDLKKSDVKGVFAAFVTKNSANWELKRLFRHLYEERRQLASKHRNK